MQTPRPDRLNRMWTVRIRGQELVTRGAGRGRITGPPRSTFRGLARSPGFALSPPAATGLRPGRQVAFFSTNFSASHPESGNLSILIGAARLAIHPPPTRIAVRQTVIASFQTPSRIA